MSIVTFWNNGREQSGKTLSIAAIATHMAIEHNYRILIVSTKYKDETLNNCFWQPKKVKKRSRLIWTKYKYCNGRWDRRANKDYEKQQTITRKHYQLYKNYI